MQHIYGYACISELHPTLKTGSTSTLTYINKLNPKERGPYLLVKARANVQALPKLLKLNAAAGINAYRIPDSFMPFADLNYYNIEENFAEDLEQIGKLANTLDIHLSFHPGQHFVLNSATPTVAENSIRNFNIYAKILDLFQLKNHPTLLTHVGARYTYKNRQQAADAFCRNFERLDSATQKYFAVENDQSCHSIDSCIEIHQNTGIPVVCDSAHYNYLPTENISLSQALTAASLTWKNRIPKVHLSSEKTVGGRHAHSDYIDKADLNAVLHSLTQKSIIMIESKKKDLSIQRVFEELKS